MMFTSSKAKDSVIGSGINLLFKIKDSETKIIYKQPKIKTGKQKQMIKMLKNLLQQVELKDGVLLDQKNHDKIFHFI